MTTVQIYHVEYCEDAHSAARLMGNVRMCGAEEVKVTWIKDKELYRVEYRLPMEVPE